MAHDKSFTFLLLFVAKSYSHKGIFLWAHITTSGELCFVLLMTQQKCKQNTNFYGAITRECKIIGGWHFGDCLKTKPSFWTCNLILRNAPLNKKLKLPLIHSICSVNWLPVFLIFAIKLWLMWDLHLAQPASTSLRLYSYIRKVLSSQIYFSANNNRQTKFSKSLSVSSLDELNSSVIP